MNEVESKGFIGVGIRFFQTPFPFILLALTRKLLTYRNQTIYADGL
jgi:hypothetical protein